MYVTFKVSSLKDPVNTLEEAIDQAIKRVHEVGYNSPSDTVYVLKVIKKVTRHFPVHIVDIE
jgi:hypothetical protein